MKKSSFVKIITILFTATTMPIMAMEPLPTTKIKKFTVRFDLDEISQEDIENPYNKQFDKADEHKCKVLGIKWEDNKNTYVTRQVYFNQPEGLPWSNTHPRLPLSTIPATYENADKDNEYQLTFPASLPATFVEELEKKRTITLKNTLFVKPVEITVELNSIRKLKKLIPTQKIEQDTKSNIINKKETQKQITTNIEPTVTSSQSNIKKYILFSGCAINVIGFIAWLLHYNNKLDLSQITNFIHNLTNK
jgi:hypothetical protein